MQRNTLSCQNEYGARLYGLDEYGAVSCKNKYGRSNAKSKYANTVRCRGESGYIVCAAIVCGGSAFVKENYIKEKKQCFAKTKYAAFSETKSVFFENKIRGFYIFGFLQFCVFAFFGFSGNKNTKFAVGLF